MPLENDMTLEDYIDYILDTMLLKAFKIVTRGVRFLDVWNEDVGLTRTIVALEQQSDAVSGHRDVQASLASASGYFTPVEPPSSSFEDRDDGMEVVADKASGRTETVDSQPCRSVPIQTGRISTSHRVSCSNCSATARNANLASEKLNAAYDAFLSVLGSFIGLHMHPRSSSELATTTQLSVHSCRALIVVVQAVCEHDHQLYEPLEEAKETMFIRLAELVRAAGEAFRPANATDDDIAFTPDAGKHLVEAATDCVRGAGNCLAKARQVLERNGDFELESQQEFSPFTQHIHEQESDTPTPQPQRTMTDSFDGRMRPLPPAPFNDTGETATGSDDDDNLSKSKPFSEHIRSLSEVESLESEELRARNYHVPSEIQRRASRRAAGSTGSSTTYNSGIRDDSSHLSPTSTRATTPDLTGSPTLKPSVSQSTLGEDYHETEADILQTTYAHELIYRDGQVVGASLRALVEKLTAHDSTPPATFVSAFYLTFRLFATPLEFAETLVDRFDYIGDTPHAVGPVRLRVSNVFKNWLETHWRHDCDSPALDYIIEFANNKLTHFLPTAGRQLVELAAKVSLVQAPVVPRLVSSMGKTSTAAAQYIHPETPLPSPNIGRKELNILRQWKAGEAKASVLDFDPLEMARQFTVKASRIYCSVLPEELLASEWMKKTNSLAVNVRAMSTLSTDLAHFVADSILEPEEPKKRAAVIKHWIKIANKCLELNNYDTLMAVICSLNSSTIARLKRTWELISQRHKNTLEYLRGIVDVSRNYAVLRNRLNNHVPPCLPFVGTYLTDLTFVDHGNQPRRCLCKGEEQMEVINFDKHMKTSRIISDFQRFQIPYRLAEVPELQTWIQDELVRVRENSEMQAFYRRSLVLEPREAPPPPPPETTPSLLESASQRFDFRSWTNTSKSKTV